MCGIIPEVNCDRICTLFPNIHFYLWNHSILNSNFGMNILLSSCYIHSHEILSPAHFRYGQGEKLFNQKNYLQKYLVL